MEAQVPLAELQVLPASLRNRIPPEFHQSVRFARLMNKVSVKSQAEVQRFVAVSEKADLLGELLLMGASPPFEIKRVVQMSEVIRICVVPPTTKSPHETIVLTIRDQQSLLLRMV
eukprot:TRINITY_DN29145_c0_g1_i1.p2 TRINITY_DN29145_c0_g1~~TRINITY_DN29145_c0_g1_i1.p2  ORF type:complete len:115 (+),score=26.93 TRINITY_DN29145_c0_g1_i1:186-530(+)